MFKGVIIRVSVLISTRLQRVKKGEVDWPGLVLISVFGFRFKSDSCLLSHWIT